MIVLKRSRILLIISLVFISIFAYTITTDKKDSTVPIVSLPVSNKVIILDAGHGIPDEGEILLNLM